MSVEDRGVPPAFRQMVRQTVVGIVDAIDLGEVWVTGSVARGCIDQWSDLDLIVTTRMGAEKRIVSDVKTFLERLDPVAIYDADHLGVGRILVGLVRVNGKLLKIDIEITSSVDVRDRALPISVVLGDGHASWLSRPEPAAMSDAQILVLYSKVIGWTWYTYARSARGELLQAISSLDFTRKRALVPLMRLRRGLAQLDYRRLEQDLGAEEVAVLHATLPMSPQHVEVVRANSEMAIAFSRLADELLGVAAKPFARNLKAVAEEIDRAEAERA